MYNDAMVISDLFANLALTFSISWPCSSMFHFHKSRQMWYHYWNLLNPSLFRLGLLRHRQPRQEWCLPLRCESLECADCRGVEFRGGDGFGVMILICSKTGPLQSMILEIRVEKRNCLVSYSHFQPGDSKDATVDDSRMQPLSQPFLSSFPRDSRPCQDDAAASQAFFYSRGTPGAQWLGS